MKHIIIGTAGHIDHGKTTLIQALTGRDTDRLAEEKKRGITIDLGFTYFDLPSGDRAGIIDVPGHEKFINNMVAGVVGMDLVLLVIAADEGIMPQTREHMYILHLLGVQNCIVVLTKCDLVDADWLELMEAEIRDAFSDTFLKDAPLVKVSAVTGEGLEELVDVIVRMTKDEVVPKDTHTIPRLPIDRVFTMSGFGTVITGTLLSGTLTKEDTLCMYPTGKECKIRNIQVHDEDQPACYAGQRVAINLSNVRKNEIKRGCVLAPKDSMKNTDLLDVRLSILPSSERILENNERLHFFTGTSEILCRAVLLDKEEIGPGESGYVQLRLEEEIAVRRGDRFVVRFYSPMETIGGGEILEPNPRYERRFKPAVIEELRRKESGSTADVIELHAKNCAGSMITQAELAKLTALSEAEVSRDLAALSEEKKVYVFANRKETYVWHAQKKDATTEDVVSDLKQYEQEYPYRHGRKKAEIQMRYLSDVKANVFDQVAAMWEAEGTVVRSGEFLSTPDFTIVKDARYEQIAGSLLKTFEEARYDFVRYSELEISGTPRPLMDDILNLLLEERTVVRVADDLYTLATYIDEATRIIREQLSQADVITIAQVRDLFETSRKSAKPILEYMDSIKVTKKTGGESERVKY